MWNIIRSSGIISSVLDSIQLLSALLKSILDLSYQHFQTITIHFFLRLHEPITTPLYSFNSSYNCLQALSDTHAAFGSGNSVYNIFQDATKGNVDFKTRIFKKVFTKYKVIQIRNLLTELRCFISFKEVYLQ